MCVCVCVCVCVGVVCVWGGVCERAIHTIGTGMRTQCSYLPHLDEREMSGGYNVTEYHCGNSLIEVDQ